MGDRAIRRGDVYYVRKYPTCGSEQQPARPAVIVSNDFCNSKSAVVEAVYLTCQEKKTLPTHVVVRSTGRKSIALCEQITSIAVERLGDYKCHLSADEMLLIDHALAVSVGIAANSETAETPELRYPDDERLLALVCLKYIQKVLGHDNISKLHGIGGKA